MFALLLATMFCATEPIPDGTLLFVEGGNQIVMDFTDSPYSHVAIIFNDDGIPYVYEAIKPFCRKVRLDKYMQQIEAENNTKDKAMSVWIRKPKKLDPEDSKKMKEYCEHHIGTKYRISSYLSGKSGKGIHCGELTARAMICGGMHLQENPCKCSPQDIMDISSKWYEKAKVLSRFP